MLQRFSMMLLLGLLMAGGCHQGENRIRPTRMTITESVYSSVTVQPDSLYQGYAAVSGILDANLVEEGDLVEKGSPLVQIINATPKLNRDNTRLALELAERNYSGSSALLRSLQDEIMAARLKYENDSVNYYRQQRLWEQGIGSQAQFDDRRLAFRLARNNLDVLQSRYERTENELETALLQARNNYKSSQVITGDFTVRSKINGKVYALLKEPGELVNLQEPVVTIGSDSAFVVEMRIDEVDIVRVEPGQMVVLTLDAYGSEVFEAIVHKIYPKKDERSQTFRVEALFKEPPETLYPGLAGEGNIVVAVRKNALTVPKSYLVNEDHVLTRDGEVRIETGIESLDRVEVRGGIDEDTELIRKEE